MIVLQRPPLDEERKPWADWFFKVYLLLSGLTESTIGLLGSKTSVNMNTGSTTIFTVPVNKTARIDRILIRSASAALGTDYDFTNFRQTVDLSSVDSTTKYLFVDGNSAYIELSAGTDVQITANTGTASTATVEVFGVLS